jgi:hypothetical protein
VSITTFTDLQTKPHTKKVCLVEIEPSEHIENWILHSGSIYKYQVGTVNVLSVEEDGNALTEVTALTDVSAGEWFYDGDYLYVQSISGTPFQNIIVANYRIYFATESKTFNDYFYNPFVKTIPIIKQAKKDWFWGISIISNGVVEFYNHDGFFDDIYYNYAWSTKTIKILMGGEDLPYSEYTQMFGGIIKKISLETGRIKITFEDDKEKFKTSLPINSYSSGVYPNIHSEDVGKPIPYVWGTVYNIPVICTNRTQTTSTYNFKVADTSTHSIQAISTVYVKGNEVVHSGTDLSAATFNLHSSTYVPGDLVTADVSGYLSGTVLLENPIDVTREIAELIGFTDSDWDTDERADAKDVAEDFPIGLYIGEYNQAINKIADIMKSCMGSFFIKNDGDISINIWDTTLPADHDTIDEIDLANLKFQIESDEIRKTIRIGWRKNWTENEYAYSQDSSNETEKVYGITRSRTIQTLLSTLAAVEIFRDRLKLIYESKTVLISFIHKLKLADKNIGDRITISYRRKSGDDYFSWLNTKFIEIQSIQKDFLNNKIKINADDLKGIGGDVGHWTEDDPEFPDNVGGGSSGGAYDTSWSESQKTYALASWGFWTDDDGFVEPTEAETLNKSRWW